MNKHESAAPDSVPASGDKAHLRLLSRAVDQSSEGIAIVNLNGDVLYTNVAFARMHGYSQDEIIGKNLSIFHTAEQLESVNSANRQNKETGEFQGEVWHAKLDGSIFPTVMHNTLIKDEAGHPIAMIGTMRDVSDRKQMEQKLRDSKRLLETLVKERTKELELKTKALEEMNVTLRVLLEKGKKDSFDLEEKTLLNIESMIFLW